MLIGILFAYYLLNVTNLFSSVYEMGLEYANAPHGIEKRGREIKSFLRTHFKDRDFWNKN